MSAQLRKLCSLLLSEYFGDSAEQVGVDLFRGGPKQMQTIKRSTKLNASEVRLSLCLLVKYGMVTFDPGKFPNSSEYRLCPENVVLLLRYPRYLILMKKLYGNEAEIIVEEILRSGKDSASSILLKSFKRLFPESKESCNNAEISLQRLKDIFEMLINKQYIKRCQKFRENKTEPELVCKEAEKYLAFNVDVSKLYKAFQESSLLEFCDEVYWDINFERLHQDMRDELLIVSVARRTNETGSELMRFVLQQMQLNSNPWAPMSNPILISDLRELCKRSNFSFNNVKDLEDYLAVMTEEFGGFLRKSNAVPSAYEVNLKRAVIELTWCVLANGVEIKYGSNAARIFRLIREQEFIEQDEIQKKAMLHDKEAKFLTYSLLQSGWIQQHELKKGLQKAGPTKTFYLFYIDFKQVVRMYAEACYKSLYNAIMLREQEKAENKCLLEKKQRIDAIVMHMKKEGATEEQVAEIEEMVTPPEHALLEKIQINVNKISQAELQIDETLFILHLCLNVTESNS